MPVPYKREVTLRHEGLPTEDQIGFAISISGGHNINEKIKPRVRVKRVDGTSQAVDERSDRFFPSRHPTPLFRGHP